MELTSPEFGDGEEIPEKFTCEGVDINPELNISDAPEETKSLVLIMDDPDAPMGPWVHWVVYDIKPIGKISEASVPGTQGINDFKKLGYGGPCPPSGTHRYFFKLYALDTELGLSEGLSKGDLETAMESHILAESKLMGLYSKK
jgi:hypothetical protein